MPKKLLVKANPGEKCPREDDPRSYITDDIKGTPVGDTAYYRRLIADGSLSIVPAASNSVGAIHELPVPAKSKSGGKE